ncbi:class I SAM-dependent methyltransferase [Actinomadura parmotrematis]|uniref:S-adenosyl-L-methionine-dependent methyltransferase n=1 Tax=Actinomadura parmotrematis TaxID=2864039 RepID=A0ABS7FU77_9ACTN|nr:SAM-dependent methyltransferase [Actinomadura parmotrematis]MBW8483964.1 SAM-dependent methyltransferase [Actinomadura parmotrematis]
MDIGKPSQTALFATAARAAHLAVDHSPFLLRDTVAGPLLGPAADEMIGYHREHGDHIVLAGTRTLTTVRAAFTERRLSASGAGQYVVLGAGLDTFAHRSAGGVRVFEVDHPATQEWKRGLLDAAGIVPPPGTAYVPADFEEGPPWDALAAAGLDASRPALVGWLGVSVYLTPEAIGATLAGLARHLAPGSELVMEYMVPPGLRDETGEQYAAFAGQAAGERGEPYRTFLTPGEVAELTAAHGLTVVEDAGTREAVPAELWDRTDALRPFAFARLVRAVVA